MFKNRVHIEVVRRLITIFKVGALMLSFPIIVDLDVREAVEHGGKDAWDVVVDRDTNSDGRLGILLVQPFLREKLGKCVRQGLCMCHLRAPKEPSCQCRGPVLFEFSDDERLHRLHLVLPSDVEESVNIGVIVVACSIG